MSLSSPCKILYLEDDPGAARLFQRRMNLEGYEVDLAPDGAKGLAMSDSGSYDVLATDQDMPQMTGLEVIRSLGDKGPLPRTVMVTGQGNECIAVEAMKLGADDYIIKDSGARYLDLIQSVVVRALEKRSLIAQHKEAEEQLRRSEQRYRSLVENLPHKVFMKDRDSVYISCNALYAEDLGVSQDEIAGKTDFDFYPSYLAEKYQADDRTVMGINQAVEVEEDYLLHGQPRMVRTVKAPVRDNRANVIGVLGVLSDITEQTRQKALLQERTRLLNSLVEALPDIVRFKDAQGRYLLINRAFEQFWGMDRQDVVGRSREEALLPGLVTPSTEADAEVLRSGKPQFGETTARPAGGRETVLETRRFPIFDDQGRVVGICSISRDITDRKKSEEALREHEERLQLVLEGADLAYWDWDLEKKIAVRNYLAAQFYGRAPDEIDSTFDAWVSAIHPDDRDEVLRRFNGCLCGELPTYEAEYRLVGRDGATTWLLARGKVTKRDANGRPLRISGTLLDITDRKNARRKQVESEEKYRTLIENMQEGVYVVQDGMLKFTNRYALERSGYSEEEALSRPFLDLVHPDDRERIFDIHLRRLRGEDAPSRYEFRILDASGNTIWLQTSPIAITWEGRPAFMAFATDITDCKKAEEQINDSVKEKDALLREIHHRVKNNLAVITSLIRRQSHYAASARSPQDAFSDLENQIRCMAVAREILHQSENMAYVSASAYIGRLLNHLIEANSRVGNEIAIDQDIEDVSFGLATAIPLGYLVTELVSNCLKHAFPNGRQGRVRLSLRSLEDGQFELTAADDGVGIAEEINWDNPASMGFELVRAFVEQLHATIAITRRQGAEIRIRFEEVGARPRR
jgi:PAS domain S-box-containing protein